MSRKLLTASVFAILATAAASASAGRVDCTMPQSFPEARACEAAARRVADLRQYIVRTRAVQNLHILDFDNAVRPSTAMDDGPAQPKVATAK